MKEGISKDLDNPEPDFLDLDTDPKQLFDDESEYRASLLTILHPHHRKQADIEKQIEGLGWYQKELSKQQGREGNTPKKLPAYLGHDTSHKHKKVRALRADLAAKFRSNLAEAKGSVEKRLEDLIPGVTGPKKKGKRSKRLSAARKKRKQAKKNKRVLSKLAKSQRCRYNNKKK